MKKKLTWFLLSISFATFIYLLFAFGNWELNPGLWTDEARALLGFAVFFAVIISNIFPHIND